jgi:hypothetical protein
MAEDVKSILTGHFDGLYSEKINLKIQYAEEEKKKHKKNLLKNGVKAGF